MLTKDTIKKTDKWATDWEKIFAKHIWQRTGIQNVPRMATTQGWKDKQHNQKNGQKIWTDTSLSKVCNWPISTLKSVQLLYIH